MSKNDLKILIRQIVLDSSLKHIVKTLSLFGSYAHGTATEESDIDLLLVPSQRIGLFELLELEIELSEKLGMKVDLLTEGFLSKYFREEVVNNAELIYEG